MFSKRTPKNLEENRLSRDTRARFLSGRPILDLTESNPTRAGFRAAPELISLLGNPDGAQYAPDPRGLASARASVSRDYLTRGVGVNPEHIVLTASSSESYSLLFKLLGNPGDHVLVPTPSYPLFEFLAELDGMRVVPYPLRFDDEWHLSIDSLKRRITEQTRAVVVVHPNNPTGSFLKSNEGQGLVQVCAERAVAIIADEVFADFAFAPDPVRHPSFAAPSPALSFALGGLSKSCALPQMKLGWIAVSGPPALRDQALVRLEFIADTYLSVATAVQLALPSLLDQKAVLQTPIKTRLARNLNALKAAVSGHKELSLLPVEGGWSALIQCPATRTDEERALHALDDGVLVHPGHFFDFESGCYLVVSLLCPTDVFDSALPHLMNAAVG